MNPKSLLHWLQAQYTQWNKTGTYLTEINGHKVAVLVTNHNEWSCEHEEFQHNLRTWKATSGTVSPVIYGSVTQDDIVQDFVGNGMHYIFFEPMAMLSKSLNRFSQESVDYLAGCFWDLLAAYVKRTNNFPTQLSLGNMFLSERDGVKRLHYFGDWEQYSPADPQWHYFFAKMRHDLMAATNLNGLSEQSEHYRLRRKLFPCHV